MGVLSRLDPTWDTASGSKTPLNHIHYEKNPGGPTSSIASTFPALSVQFA